MRDNAWMVWQGIEGHDAVAKAFTGTEARGRIAGSYLFIGPAGVGKGAFALALARALVCLEPRPGLEACGTCASCRQAAVGSHPDIDLVARPPEKSTIPLEAFIGDAAHRMREGLCWRLLLKPVAGSRKVAIVLDADHLADEAANCLLKTLEEPPPGAVIILVGTGLERQLPTIRSRCQVVRFRPLAVDAVQRLVGEVLKKRGEEIDEAAIAAAAAASGGSLDRALLLLDPELGAFRGRLLKLLSGHPLRGVDLAREVTALVDAAGKDAPPRRARLAAILESALDFYRAAVRQAATGEEPDDAILAAAVANWSGDAETAATALEQTLEAVVAIDRNAYLPNLIDAWTALLEAPRLAYLS